jgi:integrase
MKQKSKSKIGGRIWERKVFRNRDAELYYVRLAFQGRREVFPTNCAIKNQAAQVAREIYMELRTLGWEATLAKRKAFTPPQADGPITVGEFLEAVGSVFIGQKRTIADYGTAFRRIVADIFEIQRGRERYDYIGGGRNEWIAEVNAVAMEDITAEKVKQWQVGYVERAGEDFERQRSARRSVNTLVRNAAALFNSDRLGLLSLRAPVVSPFAKIKALPEGDVRYRSSIDAGELLSAAAGELEDRPELLKVFLLAICCGLRRNEVDKLEWTAFNWDKATLFVGPTRYLHVKSERSVGEVDLDPEILAVFRGYYARRKSTFVIESDRQVRLKAAYGHYRCELVFDGLISWLRGKGIDTASPIHDLRREFGSLVNQKFGIYAASAALRHADIGITSRYYVGKKQRTAVGLGELLPQKGKVIRLQGATKKRASAVS